MINKIIEEAIVAGIPITCEYNIGEGFTYIVSDFYKSGTVSIKEVEGSLIATARYNQNTEIFSVFDIVDLNYEWWEKSKERYIGWEKPTPLWQSLYEKFNIGWK